MKFISGADWIKADFHLHTKSDKEFDYQEEENNFIKKYVQKLKEEEIQLAVITNHNKFDFLQYKGLRKKAAKENVFLLPGIELNINEGKTGLHTLIVFNNEEWLVGKNDFINDFITKTAPTDNHDFKYENGRSQHDLIQTIELLNTFNKDYFIILAHVSSDNGLLNELNGKKIEQFGENPAFRKNVLGFQAVKQQTVEKLKHWLKNKLPAFVEGSDPKNIEQIGKGKLCYLKLSDFNFDAVKFAMLDYNNRIANKIPKHKNAYIKSIEYIGGKLNGTKININPAMNNIIGIRGSGKSSILETIRYALNIDLSSKTADNDYKEELVSSVLGSGGKMILEITDKQNENYTIHKTLNERTQVFKNGKIIENLKPEAIIKQALYFGQKDLSSIGDKDSIKEFISRLIGKIIIEQQEKSESITYNIRNKIEIIDKINADLQKKSDIETNIAELKLKIENFKKYGIDEKLEKETVYNKDERIINHTVKIIRKKIDAFIDYLNENENFESLKSYKSTENQNILNEIKNLIQNIESVFVGFDKELKELEVFYKETENIYEKFKNKKENLLDEFSKIKREIKLPSNIKADEYQRYKTKLENYKLQLVELQKKADKKKHITTEIYELLNELKESWHQEFLHIQKEITKINAQQENVKIKPFFKGDKEKFAEHIQNYIRGSGIRSKRISDFVEQYNDLIDFYSGLKENEDDNSHWFKKLFLQNLADFITFRIPDTYEIEYNGKPLKNHSLGQRASALIVFLFSLRNNDLILIDQPEDDLDSQTIYNEVITLLKKIKNTSQFIFATHNPNIPVLGDCEQILACNYDNNNERINTTSGGIDKKEIQQKIINIMEGGKTAFEERKNKYTQWKH